MRPPFTFLLYDATNSDGVTLWSQNILLWTNRLSCNISLFYRLICEYVAYISNSQYPIQHIEYEAFQKYSNRLSCNISLFYRLLCEYVAYISNSQYPIQYIEYEAIQNVAKFLKKDMRRRHVFEIFALTDTIYMSRCCYDMSIIHER